MAKRIILKITNDFVFFNNDTGLHIRNTSIPYGFLTFTERYPIYWLAEMISYERDDGVLNVKVVNYWPDEIVEFENQHPKSAIKILRFTKFDWSELEKQLINYQLNSIKDYIFLPVVKDKVVQPLINTNELISPYIENEENEETDDNNLVTEPDADDLNETPTIQKDEPIEINVVVSQLINDCVFGLGFIGFNYFSYDTNSIVNLKVFNEHIIPEFNVVKSYFAKALKTKFFEIRGTIVLVEKQVISSSLTSIEISKINNRLIDSVKYLKTQEILKAPKYAHPDKSLFTSEDVLSQFDDSVDEFGNQFQLSENEIIEFLKDKIGIRNLKHLEYLSGKIHDKNQKIRFSLYPTFGFLFLHKGHKMNHFIWELLNSHATYVWSTEKNQINFPLVYQRVEETISTIRSIGREKYKQSYRNNNLDNDLIFNHVKHKDVDSDFVEGFIWWKHKLDELLI